MDLHLFDLNLLVALDALLTERNVTQAGIRLNLSQSAMSGALARLRYCFQDDLLVSVGRRMMLTPLAEGLVEPVRQILLQIRGTLGTKPRFDPATTNRHLSLAVSDYATEVFISDVLRRAKCEAPFMTFDLTPVGRRAGEALEMGELDFMIAPAAYVSAEHPTEMLFEDTYTCVAWSGNQSIGDTVSIEDYLNLGHVIVQVGTDRAFDDQSLRKLNYTRRVEVSVTHFSLASQLVVGTDRVATILTRLALKYEHILPLKLVPLPIEIPPLVEMLQWHTVHDQDPANQWFRRLLKDAIANLPPRPLSAGGARALVGSRAGQTKVKPPRATAEARR